MKYDYDLQELYNIYIKLYLIIYYLLIILIIIL